MRTSENIQEIAKALAIAQGEMKPASKDAQNPHFKSRFSSLASIWETIRVPLSSQGLVVLQDITTEDKSNISITTRIIHTSGQWIEFGPMCIPINKNDAQAMGSASSYGKRYTLCAALGIVSSDEDDDGEAAMNRKQDNCKQRNDYVTKTNIPPRETAESQGATINKQANEQLTPVEKIDDVQAHSILEALAQTDDEFKKTFYHRLREGGMPSHYDLPADKYLPTMGWIKVNIDRIKNQVST